MQPDPTAHPVAQALATAAVVGLVFCGMTFTVFTVTNGFETVGADLMGGIFIGTLMGLPSIITAAGASLAARLRRDTKMWQAPIPPAMAALGVVGAVATLVGSYYIIKLYELLGCFFEGECVKPFLLIPFVAWILGPIMAVVWGFMLRRAWSRDPAWKDAGG